ncbi:ABC transporter ATP-binding protein [Clostridium sp. DJ247]|nr:ATP-binding cassette domain-containing protein [Clostridium sp. DJ247]MBC2579463.1 ABC transporter ATP-binding protein [Clostridium sp. DJ247]
MVYELDNMKLSELFEKYPYIEEFFSSYGVNLNKMKDLNLDEFINSLDEDIFLNLGIEKEALLPHLEDIICNMEKMKESLSHKIQSITIIGGHTKNGIPEDINITFKPGDIICIVGPTGSGKSRLLGDIEWIAQKDTPTGRQILINNEVPDESMRFSMENKLVAQLSQNMNFILDMTVEEFITMHAESRMISNIKDTVNLIIEQANELSGEKFVKATPVTALSGGQSRALMIADTAYLSSSPIVLIDEIENAGIDRKKALDLLIKKEKIVLMSTHDPILALMGNTRLVLKNGGISNVLNTTDLEKENLRIIQHFDEKFLQLRDFLRHGKSIDFDLDKFFTDNF